MDADRFDRLAKALVHRLPRRVALAGLLGLTAGVASGGGAAAFGCHRVCRRTRRGRVCHVACHCGPGQTACRFPSNRATCTDLQTDSDNCGGCGVSCGGVLCLAGVCATCPSHLTRCAGGCVNLLTDPAHCGNCDHVCPFGAACRGGTCCVRDGQPCPTGCAPGGYCGGCCVEVCQPDGTCGAPPPCVEDGDPCPDGCAPDGDCPGCCAGTCRPNGDCGVPPPPPCVVDSDPCPAGCAPGGGCPGCCVGTCAAGGVCGAAGCQLYGGVCAEAADCCDGVPCINGHCHYP